MESLALLAVLAIVALVFVASRAFEKRRADALRAEAASLGLAFREEDPERLSWLAGFAVASAGQQMRARNVLHGEIRGRNVEAFDFHYVTGHGKHRRTWNQTVVLLRDPRFAFPAFCLRPEGLFQKIGQAFGYQDIDFETHRAFSSSYLLRGADERAVRALFCDPALDWFERHPGLCVEGEGQRLIVYRAGSRAAPGEVRARIEEGLEISDLLAPGARGAAPQAPHPQAPPGSPPAVFA